MATRQYKNAFLVDMSSNICPARVCSTERDGVILYRDSNHLTASFVQALHARLAEEIDKALAPPILPQASLGHSLSAATN
jgi:hypothetical protein